MKKIILSVAAIFAFGFANAQEQAEEAKTYGFSKGNMYIEGGLSIATDDDSSSFSFNPKFGYFVTDKIAVGGDLDFGSGKQENLVDGFGDAYERKNNNFGIGAFARYNFLSLSSNRFVAFSELGLGFSSNKEKWDYADSGLSDTEATNTGIKANLDLGLNYFITPRLAATFTLANILSYNNENPENGDNTNSFELNVNLFNNIFDQPKFGLLYKF